MANHYDIVTQLTSGLLPEGERTLRLQEFSRGLGWRPSDPLDIPGLGDVASAHLLVEHGLEHSAVLTFLRPQHEYPRLESERRQQLLASSYNNLVDWHVAIEPSAINFIYVRASHSRALFERRPITRDSYDDLRSEIFEQVVGKRPHPNFPALDDALIQTISFWKRALSAELGGTSNTDLSRLFNAIIFVRALEDQRRREQPNPHRALLEQFTRSSDVPSVRETIARTLSQLVDTVPPFLFDEDSLAPFDTLDAATVRSLFLQFYDNQYAPYPYDFSVISKHALSRIYEHYVSLLRHEPDRQLSLLPQMPSEYSDRAQGAVYTPQFIARFFARYLRAHTTPFQFKRLTVMDPACGSGIFLRTLLEFQCDPSGDDFDVELVQQAFARAQGVDRDANAIAATQLSLSLLHLVLTNRLPTELPLSIGDFLGDDHAPISSPDAALTNPPFVPTDKQDDSVRKLLGSVVGSHGTGRIDMYLGFLKRGIDVLKPGGFGFFVLPQSFLVGANAAGMRRYLAEHCWVHCLADLSSIRVFGKTNAHVVLLIFQRKDQALGAPSATIVRCQDLVGHALQDAVEGKRVEQRYYSIYDARQQLFAADTWFILPPSEGAVRDRLASLPRLKDFLDVKQGMVTGADNVFIVEAKDVPAGESGLFVPLLTDREMESYSVPRRTRKRVFFPYLDGEKVDEPTIRKEFPATWARLRRYRTQLAARRYLDRYGKRWWEPMWPREPGTILRPKIVTPHLVIAPRFGLDAEGRFGVSRSPFLLARAEGSGTEILKLMLAVLSSRACYWYIQRHSHRYSRGYAKLENKTLRETPVPDVSTMGSTAILALLAVVDRRIRAASAEDIAACDAEIEELVSDLYGLTMQERRTLGVEA